MLTGGRLAGLEAGRWGGPRLAGFFRDRIMPQMMFILILGTPGN